MYEPDEWVSVWFWMRFERDPQVMTPLPQQDWRNIDAMTMEVYERYANEWRNAGSPQTSAQQLLGAMTGNPLLDL